MPSYPTSLDALANPTATTLRNDPGFQLHAVISTLNDIAEALESKLGIGSSTPGATAAVLRRTGAGASAWGQLTAADIGADTFGATISQNPVINGDFAVWQRGTAFANLTTYGPDRWNLVNATSGGVVVNCNQFSALADASMIPPQGSGVPLSSFGAAWTVPTAKVSPAAGDLVSIDQPMEGYAWSQLHARQWTLSFWVRATKTGKHCVAIVSGNAAYSCIGEYTITAPATWQYVTITFPASPYSFGGSGWDLANGRGVYLRFGLMVGSTYQTATPLAWTNANVAATTGVVNDCDNTANLFQVHQVRATPGPYAAPFMPRPFATELAICQRYYQKGYPYATTPGTSGGSGWIFQAVATQTQSGLRSRLFFPFPVEMRTSPTVDYWDSVGNLSKVSTISNDAITNNVTPAVTPPVVAYSGGLSWITAQDGFLFGWQAKAEL
jgi:hypothetical protein